MMYTAITCNIGVERVLNYTCANYTPGEGNNIQLPQKWNPQTIKGLYSFNLRED